MHSDTLILLNFGSTAATVTVYDSSSTGANAYYPPILIKGTTLTLNQNGGSVGVAALPGETAGIVAKVAQSNAGVAPNLVLGSGTTVTSLNQNYGNVMSMSANTTVTTVLSGSATYTYTGTGAHTTLTVNAGATCFYSGTGTATTTTVYGTLNCSRDPRAKTFTTMYVYSENVVLNNGVPGSITVTNPIQFPASRIVLNTTPGMKVTLAAI